MSRIQFIRVPERTNSCSVGFMVGIVLGAMTCSKSAWMDVDEGQEEVTKEPSHSPSIDPSGRPSRNASKSPTGQPSGNPSEYPSKEPNGSPTGPPMGSPTGAPSRGNCIEDGTIYDYVNDYISEGCSTNFSCATR